MQIQGGLTLSSGVLPFLPGCNCSYFCEHENVLSLFLHLFIQTFLLACLDYIIYPNKFLMSAGYKLCSMSVKPLSPVAPVDPVGP